MADPGNEVTRWLNKEVGRHRFWRDTWSFLYFLTAACTIIAGALTTASAGLLGDTNNNLQYTTALAAATTILASLEKVLRLREKWDLHRNIQIALEMIQIRLASDLIDMKEAVREIDRIARQYSSQLAELSAPGGTDDRQ